MYLYGVENFHFGISVSYAAPIILLVVIKYPSASNFLAKFRSFCFKAVLPCVLPFSPWLELNSMLGIQCTSVRHLIY